MWFVFDLFGAISDVEGVAYMAHIGSFLGGSGLAVLMLKKHWIVMERDEKSILEMIKPKKKKIWQGKKKKSRRKQKPK